MIEYTVDINTVFLSIVLPGVLKMSTPFPQCPQNLTPLCHVIDALIVKRESCDFLPFYLCFVQIGIMDYSGDLIILYSKF